MPDSFEVQASPPISGGGGSGVRAQLEPESIEPEGFFDDTQDETRPALADEAKKALEMAAAKKRSITPPPLANYDAEPAAVQPNDFHKALAQLQRNRDSGAPAPPPPASRPSPQSQSGGTNPNRSSLQRPTTGMDLDVPSAKDLAARVARRSLASVPPPAAAQSVPPPAAAQSVPPPQESESSVLNALLGGIVPSVNQKTNDTAPFNMSGLGLKPSNANAALAAQRTPLPIAVVGGGSLKINAVERPPTGQAFATPKTNPSAQAPSRPPGASPSRMPAAMQAAGNQQRPMGSTPAKQYDFKRWSSPDFNEMPDDGKPVTFQVYTPQDVANGRSPMRSLPMIEAPAKKGSSIVLKIGLAIVGLVIVLITAAAVILVSQDEPTKKPIVPVPSVTVSTIPIDTAPPPPSPPTAITVGDPIVPVPDDASAASATPSATATPPKGPRPGAAHPATQGPAVAPIATPPPGPPPQTPIKPTAVTPPPNPYGK